MFFDWPPLLRAAALRGWSRSPRVHGGWLGAGLCHTHDSRGLSGAPSAAAFWHVGPHRNSNGVWRRTPHAPAHYTTLKSWAAFLTAFRNGQQGVSRPGRLCFYNCVGIICPRALALCNINPLLAGRGRGASPQLGTLLPTGWAALGPTLGLSRYTARSHKVTVHTCRLRTLLKVREREQAVAVANRSMQAKTNTSGGWCGVALSLVAFRRAGVSLERSSSVVWPLVVQHRAALAC